MRSRPPKRTRVVTAQDDGQGPARQQVIIAAAVGLGVLALGALLFITLRGPAAIEGLERVVGLSRGHDECGLRGIAARLRRTLSCWRGASGPRIPSSSSSRWPSAAPSGFESWKDSVARCGIRTLSGKLRGYGYAPREKDFANTYAVAEFARIQTTPPES